MRIAFVINDITGLGGAERVVSLAANHLSKIKDFEVEILSVFSKRNDKVGFDIEDAVAINYLLSKDLNSNSILKAKHILKEMRSFYKNKNYEFIICCSSSLSILTKLSTLKSKAISSKVISWEHTQYAHLNKYTNRLQRIFYPFLDGIVTLTNFDKEIFSKFCKNVAYIPNISTFKKTEPNKLKSKKMIAVGRLNYAKGFDLLIKAFKIVHEKHPEWQLDIFGQGSLLPDLSAQIAEEGLNKTVCLRGYEPDILVQYNNASIFLLSSRTEGFPCVLIEAMSAGLPTVSFELPGFDEVITNKVNGLFVTPNEVTKFAKAIILLIEDESLRIKIGHRGKEVVKQFESENIIPKWLKLFSKIDY